MSAPFEQEKFEEKAENSAEEREMNWNNRINNIALKLIERKAYVLIVIIVPMICLRSSKMYNAYCIYLYILQLNRAKRV